VRYSHDGGHTWSNELNRSIGQIGGYNINPIWNRLGTGREWVFEFSITTPVRWSIIDATVDVNEVEKY